MSAPGLGIPALPARVVLMLLLLLAAPGPPPSRACRGPLGCSCAEERSKAHGAQPLGRRVSCGKEELSEPPDARLLPNRTVTLILSHNKIRVLNNGSFFGLNALEKLDLKHNLISTIMPGAFQGLSELRKLMTPWHKVQLIGHVAQTNLSSSCARKVPYRTRWRFTGQWRCWLELLSSVLHRVTRLPSSPPCLCFPCKVWGFSKQTGGDKHALDSALLGSVRQGPEHISLAVAIHHTQARGPAFGDKHLLVFHGATESR